MTNHDPSSPTAARDEAARSQAGNRPGRSAASTPTAEEQRLARALGREERVVLLSDARAIRAIAHDARQQVIDALYSRPEVSLTSTQLSELTGLSPSAMSYHLRALEKWGLVVRDEDSHDARNRPWRAAGTSIRISGEDEAGRVAQDALSRQQTDALHRRLRRMRELPRERRELFTGMSADTLYLDDQQIAYLDQAVTRAMADLAEAGWHNVPGPGRTRVATLWSLLPDPGAGGDSLQSQP